MLALEDSAFKPVWDLIKALRSHDDELGLLRGAHGVCLESVCAAAAHLLGAFALVPALPRCAIPACPTERSFTDRRPHTDLVARCGGSYRDRVCRAGLVRQRGASIAGEGVVDVTFNLWQRTSFGVYGGGMPREERAQIDAVQRRLALKYAELPDDHVAAVVQRAYARFNQSSLREFVPLLVERRAREELARSIAGSVAGREAVEKADGAVRAARWLAYAI
jgi:hypothetical protein